MILILSGTNRPGSNTRKVAEYVLKATKEITGLEVKLLSLEDIPYSIFHDQMYSGDDMPMEIIAIQEEYILPAEKMVILTPEYNGSFAGVLKMFIDALSVRKYAENFKGKSGALIGVSSGRAGNLRGLEHLTGLFHYLGMHIHPAKLPVSSISEVMNDGKLNEPTQEAINELLKGFLLG
ncbi:MAG: NAD(P)H-dependent oxidoreductase [Saprospiraceae bacterium]|nr:NAD(P)H-dependent oxidoreductase [Saprospiraceae bacterium]